MPHLTISAIGIHSPDQTSPDGPGTYVPVGCVYFEGFPPKSSELHHVIIDMSRVTALAVQPDGRAMDIYLLDGTAWIITTLADFLWTRAGLSSLGQKIKTKDIPRILTKLMGGVQ